MKHLSTVSMVAVMGLSLAGFALASEAPALDAATLQAGLIAAAPTKVSVAEQFARTGTWAGSDASVNLESPTEGPASISVGSGGVITIAYHVGGSIVLTPSDGGNGRVTWSCSSSAIPDALVPKGCTQAAT